MHQLFTATKPTYKSLYIRLFYVILLTLLLGNIPFANAQNGYIYIHNKTLNEESSVNFPFTLTGGPTTVPAFTLNDQPDNIAPVDLGADRAGGLWAAADGNGLYFRPSNSSTWTQKVSGTVQRVDGGAAGTCYYILANSVYYFNGSSSTLIGKPGGQDAADIASNGTYTVVTTTSGLLYRVNTSTFTAVTMPTGVRATYVDVDVAGNVYLREKSTSTNANRISKLTSAGALTAYASGGLFSTGDLAVSDDASVLLQESQFGGFFTAYRYNSSSNTWVLEPESRGMNALTGGPGGQMWGVFALSGKPNTILTRTYTGTGPSGATSAFWIDDERVGTNTPDNSILIPVASGNYSLAETIPTGWDVTGITIYDPSGNSTANVANGTAVIKVAAGEVVHVVMENTLFQVTTVASNCGDTFTETFGTGAVGSVGSPLTGLTSYHQATSVRQVQDGEYTIVSRSQDSGYGTMFDHTSGDGTGRMLMVNASYAKDIFYIRQFTGMVIGASYDLSIWAGSITGGLDPHISMEVYNDADNSLLASTTTGDVTTDNTWLNFHLPFTPTTPNIYIVLRNLNIGGDGNDLVIDDISFGLTCDHGDAPASYGTTNANLGVGHIITPTLTIGTTVDQEPDGISGTTALGDDQNGTDDEDGVASFPALNVSTTSYDLTVAVNNKLSKEATLSGWIDFNRNGTFDANERAQVVVPKNTTSVILHWTGLSGLSAGVTYARLRIATLASDVDLPTGAADDGEVEDYTLNISLNISGTVYNDANGLSDNTVSGTGTNAGGLNAILFDNTTGKVAATTPVAANGTYSFTATAGDGYTVYVTSNTATVGSTTIPTITLPTGWVNTGEYSGTGAGNDGTVNGILPLGTVNTSVSTANFGIEQLPTPGKGANTVGNNGGTSPVTVPANTFTNTTLSSDVSPGTVTSIRITAFPTNTTSLTINGTIYTSLPTGGITVPTDGSGNPTVAIAVDPANDSNPVVITFVAVDNAGKESTTTGTATINFLPAITVSGKVWDDADGSLSQNGSETGTNAGGPLYVNLVNASNTVVASVSVAADGSYALSGVPTNVTGYKLVLASSATATTPGTLPTGWVNTGENVGASNTASQGSTLGLIELTTGTSAITNQNFGIEKLPSAGSGSNTVVNAGGTSPVTVAANTFTNGGSSTDTAPGSVTAIRVTAFPSNATSLTINGSVYTASSPEFSGATPAGVVVPTDGNGNPTVAIAVDPTNDANPVSIPFKAVDNAGQESTNTGTAVISSTLVFTIAGTVFDDANGQTDNTVNGIAVNGPTLPVYVSLVSSGTIVATLPVTAAGSYTFTGVSAGTYSVVLTTNPSGSTTPDLPINWLNTAENLGTGSGSDGTADGVLTLTVAASSITDANFGIEQLPTATSTTLASQPNPGGTLPIVVPPASFTGTDPDGTVASVIYTGFPTEVTSMTINGTAYTAASFPQRA
ncbi:beta strand repeat-containing protein [Spirosoma sp. KNUC1025]|uniref:beta strand repeat-containing protein n=1 Tax=Spirosoma sp. KNUC1025 TaxID=2894082 RepID=UPI003864812A|nr:GEVED domain-containing protein [Spirosoma sp. KNUC1025]